MRYVKLIIFLTSSIFIGCAGQPPKLQPCNVLSPKYAECLRYGKNNRQYREDVPIYEIIGYKCLSPKDLSKTKSYIKRLIDNIEKIYMD